MRSDIAKICKENGRSGGEGYRKRRNELKQELIEFSKGKSDTVSREKIGLWAKKNWGGKQRAYTIKPICKFLKSSIGSRFNTVHSDIHYNIPNNSKINHRILEFATKDIEQNTFIGTDGGVWFNNQHGRRYSFISIIQPIDRSYASVYVDPVTGTIQPVPQKPRRRYHRRKITRVEVSKSMQCHYIHGFWYMVEIKSIPEPVFNKWSSKFQARIEKLLPLGEDAWRENYLVVKNYLKNKDGWWSSSSYVDVATFDILTTWGMDSGSYSYMPKSLSSRSKEVYGIDGMYASRRWQLNKKELRRYGLRNT